LLEIRRSRGREQENTVELAGRGSLQSATDERAPYPSPAAVLCDDDRSEQTHGTVALEPSGTYELARALSNHKRSGKLRLESVDG